ncbi:hypothetical protein QVD17_36079 [Tagetes erecta]|uniref:Uncharacterized protein n=1 Tax=Tagetes erecta TaxID=13708 RepID=A0AAD8JTE2_TARER|nr:hypothetical protein QVD17_36079 [Tagetes erecta]
MIYADKLNTMSNCSSFVFGSSNLFAITNLFLILLPEVALEATKRISNFGFQKAGSLIRKNIAQLISIFLLIRKRQEVVMMLKLYLPTTIIAFDSIYHKLQPHR